MVKQRWDHLTMVNRELATAEELFRRLLAAAPDAIVTVDREGRIVLANDQAEQLFGYKFGELVGLPADDLLPDVLRSRHAMHRAAYFANPTLRPMGAGLELVGRRKDGVTFPAEISLSPLETGDGLLVMAAIRDVTERIEAGEALRASETRLAQAQEIAQLGSWEWNIPANVVVWSDQLFRIFGLALGTVAGSYQEYLALIHPEDREMVNATIMHAFATAGPFDFEHRIVLPDGSVRVLHGRGEMELGEDGRPLLMHGTALDITERKQAEEALARERDLLHALMDNLPLAVYFKDAHHRFTRVNPAAAALFGLDDPDQAVGKTDFDVFPDEHAQQFWEDERPVLETGASLENRLERQTGDGDASRWMLATKVPIVDAAGCVSGLVGVSQDITNLKRIEEDLRQSEERFRSAFEWSPIGMALVGLDGRWLEVNRALCAIVGYSEDELRARTFQDITHPDDMESDLTQARRLIAGEIPSYQMEKRYIRKDGQTVWVLLTGSLIHAADGSPLSALAQVVDITARKRAEQETERALEVQRTANAELERLSRAQRDFLSVVTHEFRSPLTSILGYSEILQSDGVSPEEITEFAGIIGNNAQRLGRMVDDLLDLDRLETGQTSLKRQRVDLTDVLTEVATAFRPNGATHKISLDLEPDLPDVAGDRDRLVQVVTNLVDNAVKYSPQHGEITMAARRAGDSIHLEVRDRGIGIPAGALESIFDRYARLETGTTRRIRGTGLGLAIVREIIDAHGGRVWAESEQSVGSTFHVIVPTRDASHERPAAGGDGSSGARSTL